MHVRVLRAEAGRNDVAGFSRASILISMESAVGRVDHIL